MLLERRLMIAFVTNLVLEILPKFVEDPQAVPIVPMSMNLCMELEGEEVTLP